MSSEAVGWSSMNHPFNTSFMVASSLSHLRALWERIHPSREAPPLPGGMIRGTPPPTSSLSDVVSSLVFSFCFFLKLYILSSSFHEDGWMLKPPTFLYSFCLLFQPGQEARLVDQLFALESDLANERSPFGRVGGVQGNTCPSCARHRLEVMILRDGVRELESHLMRAKRTVVAAEVMVAALNNIFKPGNGRYDIPRPFRGRK